MVVIAFRFPGEQAFETATKPDVRAERWCQWSTRSRLTPFRKLAQTVRQYWDGIVNYFHCRITQGAVEAINGFIQLAKRRARGYRNFSYLSMIAYLVTAKLRFLLPSLLPI